MRILLDTHVFLWMLNEPSRLSRKAARLVSSGREELLLSAASVWEMAIKVSVGKLRIPEPLESWIPSRTAALDVRPLSVTHHHAIRVATLPAVHRDPFDRLLAAQSLEEGLPLLTADPVFAGYGVECLQAS